MPKILGSWSAMREYLEKEMLAESLAGRVRYGCTSYVGMDGAKIFEICIDGKQIKRFSPETVNSYFIEKGYKEKTKYLDKREYWEGFWTLLREYPVNERTEYTDEELCEALELYRNSDVQDSIRSENPLVRMFAVLDRRVGKRTLAQIQSEMKTSPDWLLQIYRIRIEAEKISVIF